jgi:hypothetical protein
LKRESDYNEEEDAMPGKLRTLCRRQIVVVLLFILALIPIAAGCGTSPVGTYQSALIGSSGPKFNMPEWKFEHNLFNSKYQRAEKEDWEDEGPG